MRDNMDTASEELERRSKYLSSLIQKTKIKSDGVEEEEKREKDGKDHHQPQQQKQQPVRVRAADMAPALQRRAFRCAREVLASMPKLDSKRLALALKKEFDTSYGPAWHCIVGTSFGSYVTHSLGGFLYFSIDKGILAESVGTASNDHVFIIADGMIDANRNGITNGNSEELSMADEEGENSVASVEEQLQKEMVIYEKFIIGMLTNFVQKTNIQGQVAALVLCHTRELAYQICHEFERFSTYLPDIKVVVFYEL